ncbi:MAG: Methionyl-tRNA synthetase, partial [uncultured Gemmatimonadetes bacterium]
EPVLHHHRDRLRQRRPPPGARLRKDRGRHHRALPPPAGRRSALLHGDGRARAEGGPGRRRRGGGPAGAGGPPFRSLPRHVGAAVHLQRPLGAHHRRAPQARGGGADRALPGAQPGRLLRKGVRGVVLRGVRAVQARPRDRGRPLRPAPHPRAAVDGGAQLVLPPLRLRRVPAHALRRAPGVPAARVAPQRDPGADRRRAGRHLSDPRAPVVGHPLPPPHLRRCGAGHVGVVRRAPQLPHRHGLPGRRLAGVVAGAASRGGQGHHAPARRHLAGDAAVRRAAHPRAGVGARVRDAGRRALQQVRGRRAGAGRRHRPLRAGCVPLLPPARGAVGRGRQLQLGAVHGALHLGAGERAGEPGQPHPLHGGEVLRRRGARCFAPRDRRQGERGAGHLPPRHGGPPPARGRRRRAGAGGRRQRLRAGRGPLEAGQGPGPRGRAARRPGRPGARAGGLGHAALPLHAREDGGAVGAPGKRSRTASPLRRAGRARGGRLAGGRGRRPFPAPREL